MTCLSCASEAISAGYCQACLDRVRRVEARSILTLRGEVDVKVERLLHWAKRIQDGRA